MTQSDIRAVEAELLRRGGVECVDGGAWGKVQRALDDLKVDSPG